MKRIFMLMMILYYCVHFAHSQHQFGLKGGVNVADQKKSSSISPNGGSMGKDKYYYGYQAGVFYKMPISKNWRISSELNFNVVGSTRRYQTETMMFENRYGYLNKKFGYIEWPVMIGYHIHKIYFSVGPALSFKLFSRMTSPESNRGSKISSYRKTDISTNLLAGYRLTSQIDLNLRYSHGLRNIEEQGAYNFSTKNRFLNLSLLHSFNGK